MLEPDGFQGGDDSEGSMLLAGWDEVPGTYGDGSAYTLRLPVYDFTGPVPEYYAVRLAPQLVGVGLLEAGPGVVEFLLVLALLDAELPPQLEDRGLVRHLLAVLGEADDQCDENDDDVHHE